MKSNFIHLGQKKKIFNFRLDFGVGLTRYKFILLKLGLHINRGVRRFFKLKINVLKRYKLLLVYRRWCIAKKLRYRLKQYLFLYKKIYNYKFLRFKFGLPVNGQRTHTNRKNSFRGLIEFRKVNMGKLKKNKNNKHKINKGGPVKVKKIINKKKK